MSQERSSFNANFQPDWAHVAPIRDRFVFFMLPSGSRAVPERFPSSSPVQTPPWTPLWTPLWTTSCTPSCVQEVLGGRGEVKIELVL